MDRIKNLFTQIYGDEASAAYLGKLRSIMETRRGKLGEQSLKAHGFPLDETDAFVITYGDQFRGEGKAPLGYLADFAREKLASIVSGIHILPFFPYTSDDGFSVVDYREVNPDLGDWGDVEDLGREFSLMSDLVLNHCSASSQWFKGFLAGEDPYNEYFITADPTEDFSYVTRPRALPLLHPFETEDRGTVHVWTTFSRDQVDLNFSSPRVCLEFVDILLYHISRGIDVIRLDAIAYLWKERGHPCIHHEKTHLMVKLFRAIVDELCPWVVILTETNVPHEENVSYFGSGTDEAHMVYQFSLPPLVLEAFARGDATHLREWASTLPKSSQTTTFFNFLASHDGVGVTPTYGILSEEELEFVINTVRARGGLISYKATAAVEIPYELNVNYCDAIAESDLAPGARAKKFLASQSILLAFPGVPGIYIHSLVGSGNYSEGVKETGMNRTINREKLEYAEVMRELEREGSIRNLVYEGYARLLKVRRSAKAFHPLGGFELVPAEGPVLAFRRVSPDGDQVVLCVVNTGNRTAFLDVRGPAGGYNDLLGGGREEVNDGRYRFELDPYEVLWLEELE